jgi:hypothetical protein
MQAPIKNNISMTTLYMIIPLGIPTAPINQVINTDSRTNTYGVRVSYLEPIGKVSFLGV